MSWLRITTLLAFAAGALALADCANDPSAINCSTGIVCPSPLKCAAAQAVCITNSCGNGVLDTGEQCDDGNILDGDGCSHDCTKEGCGNGVVDPGEDCDPPGTVTATGIPCSSTCKFEVCGNGVIDGDTHPPEACDDGSANTDMPCATPAYANPPATCSTCTTSCSIRTIEGPYCGDGICQTADGETITNCMSDCAGCGNGILDPGEECDDGAGSGSGLHNTDTPCPTPPYNAMMPNTCSTCTTTCTIDTVVGPFCGDGMCSDGETQTTCPIDCTGCGNGLIEGTEACDNGSANTNTPCTTPAYHNPPLTCSTCTLSCTVDIVTGPFCGDKVCSAADNETPVTCPIDCAPVCGDGTAEAGEQCDGTDLNGATCSTLGFAAGTLKCNSSCNFDVSGCTSKCGDGIAETGEQCDGTDLNKATCVSLGFAAGTLSCKGNCTYNVSGCTSDCGDGVAETGEECDGSDLNGASCTSLGYATGTLACSSTCAYDVSGCSSKCGDGIAQTGEQCDGSALNGATCTSLGFTGGTLDCNSNCTYNTTNCSKPATCSDGVKNEDETDIDCGGTTCFARCGFDEGCLLASDCKSGICTADKCAASCTDGFQDGLETDVDCGGTTCDGLGDTCGTGLMCVVAGDCTSKHCGAGKTCIAATCTDGILNGTETDTDCGGATCDGLGKTCGTGKMCGGNSDCTSDHCSGGLCVAATCTDGILNGTETDVDCGGGTCDGLGDTCPDGEMCAANNDCQSKHCSGGTCATATCTDGILNGTETDTDCGGATCDGLGDLCASGKKCAVDGDCTSGTCKSNNTCM